MIIISVSDATDSFSRILLDGNEYLMRFTYNAEMDYWSFGLYRSDETPIIASVKVVPNIPLFFFYTHTELPAGSFIVLCDTEKIGRDSFNDGSAQLIYYPHSELQ